MFSSHTVIKILLRKPILPSDAFFIFSYVCKKIFPVRLLTNVPELKIVCCSMVIVKVF